MIICYGMRSDCCVCQRSEVGFRLPTQNKTPFCSHVSDLLFQKPRFAKRHNSELYYNPCRELLLGARLNIVSLMLVVASHRAELAQKWRSLNLPIR
jgi:hypothetical protein